MSVCGLSEAKTLAEVARALNMTSLPHLCLHLLNCLPLVGFLPAIPVLEPQRHAHSRGKRWT